MCYHHEDAWSRESLRRPEERSAVVENALMTDLRLRLAETEARLARARAREAELGRRLQEMRRFASVMEILESYLRRCYQEKQELVSRLRSTVRRRDDGINCSQDGSLA